MGHFKVSAKNRLSEMNIGDKLPESDYSTITPEGYFVQLEYDDEGKYTAKGYTVEPGIYSIKYINNDFKLIPTSYVKDQILTDFKSTKDINGRIDSFFNKISVYKDHGIDIPRRAALLWGPAGTGKTTALVSAVNKYGTDGKTLVILWATDRYDASDVKDFVSNFKYKGVERMILIAEDIGGVEIDNVKMKSDSSLLSLLDNQEKTFVLPIYIIGTTNFPEVFLGNLTNRPGRFDDKIEVGYPTADQRLTLLNFFNKNPVDEMAASLVKADKCKEFSAAHLKEIILRSAVFDKSLPVVIQEMVAEIELYNKAFSKRGSIGLSDD